MDIRAIASIVLFRDAQDVKRESQSTRAASGPGVKIDVLSGTFRRSVQKHFFPLVPGVDRMYPECLTIAQAQYKCSEKVYRRKVDR